VGRVSVDDSDSSYDDALNLLVMKSLHDLC
jgi:hypothetical protein